MDEKTLDVRVTFTLNIPDMLQDCIDQAKLNEILRRSIGDALAEYWETSDCDIGVKVSILS